MKRYDLQVGRIKHDCGESFVANMVEVAEGRYAEHAEATTRIAELTAEVADKREALKLGLEYWADRQQRYKNRAPVWVEKARKALKDGE
jgi:hypothetical protein